VLHKLYYYEKKKKDVYININYLFKKKKKKEEKKKKKLRYNNGIVLVTPIKVIPRKKLIRQHNPTFLFLNIWNGVIGSLATFHSTNK